MIKSYFFDNNKTTVPIKLKKVIKCERIQISVIPI